MWKIQLSELISTFPNAISADELISKLNHYSSLMMKYNEKTNITAITDPNEIMMKHFYDSLVVLSLVDIPLNASIIDVGTGAGFPLLPMKLARPDLKVVLCDSIAKKTKFVAEIVEYFKLDASVVTNRAEILARDSAYRESFDYVIARAVADYSLLAELCTPFLRVGGFFLGMKGATESIRDIPNALATLGCDVVDELEYSIPDFGERKLGIARKVHSVSTEYPRRAARMKSSPLK